MTTKPTQPLSIRGLLVKALFKRNRATNQTVPVANQQTQTWPVLSQAYAHLSEQHVNQYHRCVDWSLRSHIHPCYLHLLAFHQHLQVLLSDQVPYAVMGLVHLHNKIEQLRPVNLHDDIVMQSHLAGFTAHNKGTLIQILSEAMVSGEPVWRSRSDFLHRHEVPNLTTNSKKTAQFQDAFQPTEQHIWHLATDIGRRYATISGDYNPIHLWPVTARAMGFKRHIAHGMWSKARAISQLAHLTHESFSCEVEFMKPVFLPANVDFDYFTAQNHCQFSLSSKHRQLCHMVGSLLF